MGNVCSLQQMERAPIHHWTRTRSLPELCVLLCLKDSFKDWHFFSCTKTKNPCCSFPPTVANNELGYRKTVIPGNNLVHEGQDGDFFHKVFRSHCNIVFLEREQSHFLSTVKKYYYPSCLRYSSFSMGLISEYFKLKLLSLNTAGT